MWHKEYRDYPTDSPLIKNQVGPSKGIIGCEMHDLNGWGNNLHIPLKSHKKGLISTLLERFFSLFGGSKMGGSK
ncbi:MAG: hypothetical protein LLG04_00835 [Parachlamydia sp.]|nr:hypothetical protein [Parachlamydia sp.]